MPLRFTIRDLLWLTLVVALCLGWWLDHQDRYSSDLWRSHPGSRCTYIVNQATGQTVYLLHDGSVSRTQP